MASLLIIEDDADTFVLIRRALASHQIIHADTISLARQQLSLNKHFDLIVLDLILPDGNGMDLFQEIKSMPNFESTPIIFLSSRDSTVEKVAGLSLGASDYVTKPFAGLELAARVDLRLKQFQSQKNKEETLKLGPLNLDLLTQRVTYTNHLGNHQIEMTSMEFKILIYFVRHKDHVISRNQLLENVWSNNVNVLDRTIDSHISKVRKKLEVSGVNIESVYGAGYRLNIEAGQ